jgi:hypothetical protein
MVTAIAVLLLPVQGGSALAARRHPARDTAAPADQAAVQPRGALPVASVPLPRPRPPEAPKAAGTEAAKEEAGPEKPAEPDASPSPQPSACRQALTEDIAIAPSIPSIHGPGACGGDDLVRLEAVVLPDKKKVTLTPPATLRCGMAAAIADWVRTDVVAIAESLGSAPTALDNYDSYECRSFNRIPGGHLSEHGRANALDVRGFKLADGRMITLTDRTVAREVRERVLHSVCARFMTVLGPDSDWYHEEHIHLDLMERRNNYKICQWDVLDPLPRIAPLLPAERPDEAPPRQVAKDEKDEKAKGSKASPAAEAPPPDAAETGSPDMNGEEEAAASPGKADKRADKKARKNPRQARHGGRSDAR